jgi:hypothetical protein
MGRGFVGEPGDEGPEGGVGPHPGRVEEQLPPPHQVGVLAEVDHLLE